VLQVGALLACVVIASPDLFARHLRLFKAVGAGRPLGFPLFAASANMYSMRVMWRLMVIIAPNLPTRFNMPAAGVDEWNVYGIPGIAAGPPA
jgi:hypothetical protein